MMDKANTWLIRVFAVVLICVCLFAYLNAQANQSLLRSKPSIENLDYKAFLLRPKPSIEDLEYKALNKLREMLNLLRIEIMRTMKNLGV